MKTKHDCILENMAPEFIAQAADMLRLMAHPARLSIVDVLHSRGPMNVSTLTDVLDITQSATSQHLTQMRRTGLLKSERHGKEVWYSITDERPISLLKCLCTCCEKND